MIDRIEDIRAHFKTYAHLSEAGRFAIRDLLAEIDRLKGRADAHTKEGAEKMIFAAGTGRLATNQAMALVRVDELTETIAAAISDASKGPYSATVKSLQEMNDNQVRIIEGKGAEIERLKVRISSLAAPIALYLTCPGCGARHVDEGEFATKPHHTHACQACGLTWRPAVVNTVGVKFLPGFKSA